MMPPPPKPGEDGLTEDATTSNSTASASSTTDTSSSSYPLNLDALVSSGLLSQTQFDTIKYAYDTVNA